MRIPVPSRKTPGTPSPHPRDPSPADEAPAGTPDESTVDTDSTVDTAGPDGDGANADENGGAAAADRTDDDTDADDDTRRGTDGAIPPRRSRLRRLLRPRRIAAAVLVLALLGGLAYAGSWFLGQRAENQARTEALAAAERYAVDLSSYDYQDLDGNFAAVERNSTGQFGQQYRQVSNNLTDLIKQHEATSNGNVVTAGVSEVSADRAVVVLFVDQKINNANSQQPRVDRNRMEMTLVRDEDRWLVDNVKLL